MLPGPCSCEFVVKSRAVILYLADNKIKERSQNLPFNVFNLESPSSNKVCLDLD